MSLRRVIASLVCAAVALAGCGGGSSKQQIPRTDASQLIALLRAAKRQASANPPECNGLSATIRALQTRVQGLPASVDTNVRDSITNGINNLSDLTTQQCAQTQTTTTTPTTTTTTTTPTVTQTTTTPTQTTPTQTTPTQTTPTTPTTGGATPPGNSADGNGPPGQKKKQKQKGGGD